MARAGMLGEERRTRPGPRLISSAMTTATGAGMPCSSRRRGGIARVQQKAAASRAGLRGVPSEGGDKGWVRKNLVMTGGLPKY